MAEEPSDEELKDLMSQLENNDMGFPKPTPKDTIFKFFRTILETGDTSKASNLDKEEIGNLPLTVREYQASAAFAESQGLSRVSAYLMGKSEITLATALSKKGFFLNTVVTQIKREQKGGSDSVKKSGFSLFGPKKSQEGV